MAEPTAHDRLRPSILDRLRDDEPQRRTESVEARGTSRFDLRESVTRDLAWLFNTTRPEPSRPGPEAQAWQASPYARDSVVNLGLPALSGVGASTIDFAELARIVRDAIVRFEPRIESAGLDVQVVGVGMPGAPANTIRLRIRGTLRAHPLPLELLLSTDLDIESGLATVRNGG